MSPLRENLEAIELSDIHLSHTPPPLRSKEPDWYEAMARSLNEVKDLQQKHQCPVIVAGDIFDDGWRERKCPPELINFAIDYLPVCWAIPGQHDLPHHRYEDISKSAYWTLVEAGRIKHLPPGKTLQLSETLFATGFPWGCPITPCEVEPSPFYLRVAVVHSYVWIQGHGYFSAPLDQRARNYRQLLKSYDCAVFGDNHSGFLCKLWGGYQLLNCGCFMRRTANEINYTPQVGLLRSNGTVKIHHLDTSNDVYINPESYVPPKEELDLEKTLDAMRRLYDKGIDFVAAVNRAIKKEKVRAPVAKMIIEAMGRHHGK